MQSRRDWAFRATAAERDGISQQFARRAKDHDGRDRAPIERITGLRLR
jgi:hypothetical protein